MAPLRSSRSTRNQDHQAAARNRPGVVDLDPTEGLPVQKWEQVRVRVNQDSSTDLSSTTNLPSGTTTTSSAEWAAQFNTPQYPWPEKPLPSFFPQLPPWNQEMIRRARAGNTNPKLSVWDSKTNSWLSAAEAEKRQKTLKSVHLNNLDSSSGSKQNTVPDSPVHEADDDHDDKSDDEMDGDNADDDIAPASKRRKKYMPEERTFEVKRWVQLPPAVADKTEERKFLADRRPGMPSLYGGPYQNQVFGSMGLSTNGYGYSVANAGYDLGDGGGLGNAGGVLQSTEANVAPVRKNMPPKRKKKKGGPGRKKANPNPVLQTNTTGEASSITETGTLDGTADSKLTEDVTMADGDNDGSDSGSEGEGSEEGEIDEGGHDNNKQNDHVDELAVVPEKLDVEQQAPIVENEQEVGNAPEVENKQEPVMEEITEAEATKATFDASNADLELGGDVASADTIMPDQAVAEESAVAEPIAEVIPSIIPPPVSEQLPELPAVPAVPAVPFEPTALASPPPEQLAEIIQSNPQPQEQIPDIIQPQDIQPLEPEAVPTEPSLTAAPLLDPLPVDPITELSPITTTVAEAMDQPSVAAPGTDQLTPPLPAVEVPAPSNPTQPAVPEPTSPDLLGGLEDELDKNMGEQSAE